MRYYGQTLTENTKPGSDNGPVIEVAGRQELVDSLRLMALQCRNMCQNNTCKAWLDLPARQFKNSQDR